VLTFQNAYFGGPSFNSLNADMQRVVNENNLRYLATCAIIGQMPIITRTDLSNREFLEMYALPGRIGLAGGQTLVDKALAMAQRHVDPLKEWGHWSHAFVFQGKRHDGRQWMIESDLEIHRKHIRLGVQENRVDKLFVESLYGSLAVLDFGLTDEQTSRLLGEGLELVATRARYSLRELVGTLVALRHPSLRGKANVLGRDNSFYCSAFVRHLFVKAGIDLTPGLDIKNTTPEDLWLSVRPHDAYVLQHEARPTVASKVRERVARRIKKLKGKA
jgi:hypothetical protein